MNKREFLQTLESRLNGLSQEDIKRSLDFYSEMIDDRIDDGFTQQEAVAAIGTIDEIVSQILSEVPIQKLIRQKVTPSRKLRAWEIVLIVLGSPVWLPLIFAAICVELSVYVLLGAVVVCLYAIDFSLAAAGIFAIYCLSFYIPTANAAGILMCCGACLFCIGLFVLLFLGFNQVSKATLRLSKRFLIWQKSLFVGKKASK